MPFYHFVRQDTSVKKPSERVDAQTATGSISSFCKGLAICTLHLGRRLLMSTDLDLAKSAVFPAIAMIFTGIDAALDAVIFITFVHNNLLF
jgi:hypothetical protein